jgi:RNA polymerase sigma-70 factor (TIGR02960 family)
VVSLLEMTDATLTRARAGDEAAFRQLTDPYRRELQLHCYRIVGSTQDAEDLLQETLLAAWRGIETFEGRSSVRSWLYTIATNRSLNALRDGARRPPLADTTEYPPPTRYTEPLFLEPYPDVLLDAIPDQAPGPDARYEHKEAIGLAFVAGLQRLPPGQRAVLVLRDVLGYQAAETAEMLSTTTQSVNSALQRARSTLEAGLDGARRERLALPRSDRERALVAAFMDAFANDDIDGLVSLFTDDARITMPPEPLVYEGRPAVEAFLRNRIPHPRPLGTVRLIDTRANGQPAFAAYLKDAHSGAQRCMGLFVLTVEVGGISEITRFADSGVLAQFGLPRTLH